MSKVCQVVLAALAIGSLTIRPTIAQQPPAHAPQVHAVLISGDELYADLKFLTDLAGTDGAKAWKPLKDTLDTFFEGIDKSKPIIVEVLMNASGSENRLHFPLAVVPGKAPGQAFLGNLKGFGIEQKRLGSGFYELKGAYLGFLRLLNGFGSIAEKRDSLPANLANPVNTAATLIAKKFDIALLIKNDKQDEAAQKARRADFQKTKDNLLAGLKAGTDERKEDFELRKEISSFGLDELERFLADSTELLLGWNTDAPKNEGRLELDLTLIKGSSLDKAAEDFGKDPGLFASVPRAENAIFSGRINFPLDEQRKTHATKFFTAAKASAAKTIEADTNRNAEQKAAFTKASDLWFDMLIQGTKGSMFNGMVDVTKVSGETGNLVFGIKSPNPQDLKPILELVPKFKTGGDVKFDVDKVGDVAIHQVTWPMSDNELADFYGKDAPVAIGIGTNAFWVAIGAKSMEQLKAAITASGKTEGTDASIFFEMFGKTGPLVEVLETRRARIDAKAPPKKLTEAEAKNKKDRDAHRKLAIDTFKAGKDTFETKLVVKEGRITGQTRFDEGILRFVGAAVSKFSNETLK